MFNKFPRRSGIYHINDNVEQLQFRVLLKPINSLLKLPKFDLRKNAVEKWRSRSSTAAADENDADEIREVCIKWQEKILSANEMKCYEEASNCETATQKRYHEWLQAGGGARVADEFQSDESSDEMQPPNAQTKSRENAGDEHIFTYIDEDKHHPEEAPLSSPSQIRKSAATAEMYVYATLQASDTLLLTLRWDADARSLHIYPDFCDFRANPYFLQIDADYCHLYAYGIENISPSAGVQPPLDDGSCGQLPLMTHWQSEQQLAAEFAMPAKHQRRVVLLLELREARDFNCASLHVRYGVRLPANVTLEEGFQRATTHSVTAQRGSHHFGHCWQLTLLCEDVAASLDGGLCHVFFELISIDGWQRERVEGYAHSSFALESADGGDCMQRLRCLRPVDSFYDSLSRYFIGGRRHFDWEHFVLGKKHAEDGGASFQSRYGCRMQSTGQLLLSCRRLTQRNCKLLQPCRARSNGMTLDDIMSAYREARQRLETIVLQ